MHYGRCFYYELFSYTPFLIELFAQLFSNIFQTDVDILQGRKLNIKSAEGDSIIDQIAHNSKLFNVRFEEEEVLGYCHTVRPIIKNTIGQSSCLGPHFAGIISVEQSFSALQPEITDDIPV